MLAGQLVSRNMIHANTELFRQLVSYCNTRGEYQLDSSLRRYVKTDNDSKSFLRDLKITDSIRFGLRRSIMRLSHGENQLFATIGFEFESQLRELLPCDSNAGAVVALLSEMRPLPTATASVVRNVVEVGSIEEGAHYTGHEAVEISDLFPQIRLYSAVGIPDESTWRIFLLLGLDECRQGDSWMDPRLTDELESLSRLEMAHLPYAALCRSIFDWDPSTMFMALYRCIEATYAYESSRRILEKLDLSHSWRDVAAALETEIGWHPKEADSLGLVLRHALESDLLLACACLHTTPTSDIRTSAARAIYQLRNSLVHYRPGQEGVQYDVVDWNRLCECLTRIVFNVFTRAFEDA